jgi:hypothetical protein
MAGIFRSTEVLGGVKNGNNKIGYAGEYAHLVSTAAKTSGLSAAERKHLAELNAELDRTREELQKLKATVKQSVASGGKKAGKKSKAETFGKEAQGARRLQQRIAEINGEIDKVQNKSATSTSGDDVVMAVRDSATPADCRINIRGEVNDLGDSVPRGFVRVLTYPDSPDVNPKQSGRLQLAMWLANKKNPLTARVMANRVWYHLFGRGIVSTVDNFGALGEPPTNQPLLDYLAVRFVDGGWSVKKLIREVMLSRAYQLCSEHNEADYTADPDNTLVWRMNRRRLDAEAIRDSVLYVAGSLDLKRPHGSPTESITGEIGRRANTDGLLKDVTYRSAYLPIVRGLVPEFLSLFDVADPELVTGQRDVTTIAPQALYLMNNHVVLEQADKATHHLLTDSRLKDESARVDYAFRLFVGHSPDAQQRADVLAFLEKYAATLPGKLTAEQRHQEAWSSVCQSLMASAEFRYVY